MPWPLLLLLLLSLPAQAEALFLDRKAAEQAQTAAQTRGEAAHLETVQVIRPLTTLSLVFPRRREAERAVENLRRHGIDAFLRRYRGGGWIVHAGAHADPDHTRERRERLHRLGYRHILVGRVQRPVTAYRLVIDPPPPAPPSEPAPVRRPDLRLALDVQGLAWRADNRWQNGRQLLSRLGGRGTLGGWRLRAEARLDGWQDEADPRRARLRLLPGPTWLRHEGADGQWTVGLMPIDDPVPARFQRQARLDLSAPPPRFATLPVSAVQWLAPGLDGRLTLRWSPWFQPAYDGGGLWRPIDPVRGRLLERRPTDALKRLVQETTPAGEPTLHGGFNARYQRRRGGALQTFTLGYDRPSLPYYRVAPRLAALLADGLDLDAALAALGGPALEPIHPPAWTLGFGERTRRWSLAARFISALPYTRPDLSSGETSALHLGLTLSGRTPGPTQLALALDSTRLTSADAMLDRRAPTHLQARLQRRLTPRLDARARIGLGLDRAELLFSAGLDLRPTRDTRLSLRARLFAGQEDTLGGFYAPYSHIALGWHLEPAP